MRGLIDQDSINQHIGQKQCCHTRKAQQILMLCQLLGQIGKSLNLGLIILHDLIPKIVYPNILSKRKIMGCLIVVIDFAGGLRLLIPAGIAVIMVLSKRPHGHKHMCNKRQHDPRA